MVRLTTSLMANDVDVPDSWANSNWEHPYVFLSNIMPAQVRPRHRLGAPANKVNTGWQFQTQLGRRSLMGRSVVPISFDEFTSLLGTLFSGLADHPHLLAGVGTRGVEGFHDDAYLCHLNPRSLRAQTQRNIDWTVGIQGQGWARGAGACLMLGADWSRMDPSPVQREYDYAHALFDTGRLGQSLTMEARNLGLRTRMTPAVKESFFAELLYLGDDSDILYYLEIARPAVHPGDTLT